MCGLYFFENTTPVLDCFSCASIFTVLGRTVYRISDFAACPARPASPERAKLNLTCHVKVSLSLKDSIRRHDLIFQPFRHGILAACLYPIPVDTRLGRESAHDSYKVSLKPQRLRRHGSAASWRSWSSVKRPR